MKTLNVVSLNKENHWSIATLARAAVPDESVWLSVPEIAAMRDLEPSRIIWWHNIYYKFIKEFGWDHSKHQNYVMFYHDQFEGLADPNLHHAAVYNTVAQVKLSEQYNRPIARLHSGGSEDAVKLHESTERSIPQDKLCIGVIGGAGHPTRKGQQLLPALAKYLDPEKYVWQFLGIHWVKIAAQLREMGFEAIEPGFYPQGEQFSQYKNIDIYPLLSEAEGIPLTLLETMGCGIWPVCTICGIVPEVIQDGDNGNIVPRESPRAIANAIMRLDREFLERQRPVVKASVSEWTWDNFRAEHEGWLNG